ncbi:hypothetical protein [Streptomyces sp. NPDC051577]|uniref:hypothetical protein n=1 Tax=Streptomyces sp. NPDC051577 TaxID=3155166 RepID=UPI0034390929
MSDAKRIICADLGPNVAAFTCRINDQPTAVVNTAVERDTVMRHQAVGALLGAGFDAGAVLGVLHGVRR